MPSQSASAGRGVAFGGNRFPVLEEIIRGHLVLKRNAERATPAEIHLEPGDTSKRITFKAPATMSAEAWCLILPNDLGTVGQVLEIESITDREATLQWATPSGGGGGSTVEIARISLSTTATTYTTTATTLPFDRVDQAQSWLSNASGVITLQPGTYMIFADITPRQTSGNNRTEIGSVMQQNSSGSYVDMVGTTRRHYSRNNSYGETTGSISTTLVVGTAHQIRIQSIRTTGPGTCSWLDEGSSLTIMKIG